MLDRDQLDLEPPCTVVAARYLEKPSLELMRSVGAILPGDGPAERTLTDSDFLFDRATAKLLLKVPIIGKGALSESVV